MQTGITSCLYFTEVVALVLKVNIFKANCLTNGPVLNRITGHAHVAHGEYAKARRDHSSNPMPQTETHLAAKSS